MQKYDYIFFDLDGTLSESAPGIVNCVAFALNSIGVEVRDREELKKFVGPPLLESFPMFYGLSPEQTGIAVKAFRDQYAISGIYENEMYEGIDIMLKKLCDAGKIPVVATSKPEPFARKIMQRYGIDKYFLYIAGSTIEETRTKKAEVIAYALEACKIEDRSRVVMVGDRFHDVVGAKENGIDCIGILYGYGDRKELEDAGAIAIAGTIDELTELLI
jgi:phosphoglycolate phosphatase